MTPSWRGAAIGALALILVAAGAAWVWRDDILRTTLDPKTPFQTYAPPPAPDYARRAAWGLLPDAPERWTAADPAADVFFVHPTTYDGGREWNAAVDDADAVRRLDEVMLPNYAAPYARVARVFAPRYRQASLYARLSLREDARDAQRFAYDDVRRAFRLYVERYNGRRPFLLVGVEQGGSIAARLLSDEVAGDPALTTRLVGVHLIEAVVPEQGLDVPPCASRGQARCVLAYTMVRAGDSERARRRLQRALVWSDGGQLDTLGERRALCVNPVLGARTDVESPVQAHRGGANATGLEWGSRPGFRPRQVSAQCQGGVLYVSRPESPGLRPRGGWAERQRAPGYNLFYADLEADAEARIEALTKTGDFTRPAPPLQGAAIRVGPAPVHRID